MKLKNFMKQPTKKHMNPLFPHQECDCAHPEDRMKCSRNELLSHGLGRFANDEVDPCQCTCHDEHDKK